MKSNEHFSTLHDLFHQVFLDFGEETLTENRLKGIISDYGGMTFEKYKHVIARSVSYQLGRKLLELRDLNDADFNLKLCNIRQAFQEDNFFQHDIANYVVDCYLYGFEWIDSVKEFKTHEGSPADTDAGELSFAKHSGYDYCGNLNEDNERSGFGISKDENSNYYAGEWKRNLKNGIGIHVSSERQKYAGEWRLNRQAGVGIEIMPDGNKYAGEWKNGKKHGSGIIYYPNGEKMHASFKNGALDTNAVGVYYMKDNSYVVGHMTENGPDGDCMHYFKDNSSAAETWQDGVLE